MFFKRNKIEVVAPMEQAEYEKEWNMYKFATRTEVAIATAIPSVLSVGLATHQLAEQSAMITASAPVYAPSETVIPTGAIADASLTMLANVLDPVLDLLVAISFPIASVIVVASFFLIMIGNQEKAFDMMMKAGLGYILIQLSPMLLEILRNIGQLI